MKHDIAHITVRTYFGLRGSRIYPYLANLNFHYYSQKPKFSKQI